MKENSISNEELLVLISKNIDIKELKKQNRRITKKRIDKLFHELTGYVKECETPAGTTGDLSNIHSQEKKYHTLIINIDGASKGNPGKSGIGVAIFDKDLNLVKEVCEYIGTATNNVSEYKALILGVKEAIKLSPHETVFKSDSELLVKQIKGEYRVKNPHLMYLFSDVQGLLKKLPKWKIKHVPREENRQADMLANKGIESSTNS